MVENRGRYIIDFTDIHAKSYDLPELEVDKRIDNFDEVELGLHPLDQVVAAVERVVSRVDRCANARPYRGGDHGAGGIHVDRTRCVPGGAHVGHLDAGHEAQRARHPDRGDRRCRARGVPHRRDGSPRTGPRR